MTMMRTFFPLILFLTFFVIGTSPVFAAEGPTTGATQTAAGPTTGSGTSDTSQPITLTNPLSAPDLPTFLNQILGFLIKIGGIVITFMVVYVGFKFVMAQGEPGALTEAKSMLMWTLIGAAILLGAQAISLAIQQTVQAIS